MKRFFTIIFITSILISCKNNEYEKKIIGTWYSLLENEKLTFDSDSLFVNNSSKIGTWNATENEIEYLWQYYKNDSIKKITHRYRLHSKDTLFLFSNDSTKNRFTFIKADNFLDLILKKNNVQITLNKNPNSEFKEIENAFGIKIFISSDKGKINAKSEYSDNIENLKSDLELHLNNINPYLINRFNNFSDSYKEKMEFEKWRKRRIYYSIFADREILNDSILTIVEKLKKSEIQNVYQVFETEEQKYSDNFNLRMIKL